MNVVVTLIMLIIRIMGHMLSKRVAKADASPYVAVSKRLGNSFIGLNNWGVKIVILLELQREIVLY